MPNPVLTPDEAWFESFIQLFSALYLDIDSPNAINREILERMKRKLDEHPVRLAQRKKIS